MGKYSCFAVNRLYGAQERSHAIICPGYVLCPRFWVYSGGGCQFPLYHPAMTIISLVYLFRYISLCVKVLLLWMPGKDLHTLPASGFLSPISFLAIIHEIFTFLNIPTEFLCLLTNEIHISIITRRSSAYPYIYIYKYCKERGVSYGKGNRSFKRSRQ